MDFTQSLFYEIALVSLLVLGLLVTFIYTSNNFKLGTSQKIIAVLLFFLNIRILLIHFYLSKIILDYPHALLITHLISRIAIPLLFLVIFYDVIRPYWKWYDSFHFLPVLIFVFIFKEIYLGTAEEKQQILLEMYRDGYDIVWSKGNWMNENFVLWVRTAPLLIYIALIILVLLLNQSFRPISKSTKQFFVAVVLFMSVNLTPLVVQFLPFTPSQAIIVINFIGFLATFIMLIYFFFIPDFLYSSYFSKQQTSLSEQLTEAFQPIESDTSEFSLLFTSIQKYLETTKIYLDPEFNLKKLAIEMGISDRQISTAIKVVTQVNFARYINDMRINYLINTITKETIKNDTFNTIAFKVGFNSVNSFYFYFKQNTGSTPQNYFNEKFKLSQL